MDRGRIFQRRDGRNIFRVTRIFNLVYFTEFINSEYEIELLESNELSDSGLLVLFKIKPKKDQHLPYFSIRFDENVNALDVDIANTTSNIKKLFTAERGGYYGHHSTKISDSPRFFEVKIKIPKIDICLLHVTFNVSHGHDPALFQ